MNGRFGNTKRHFPRWYSAIKLRRGLHQQDGYLLPKGDVGD